MSMKLGWIFLSSLAVAAAVAVGCGGRKSGENESCQVTDDCADGFVCVGDVCRPDPNAEGAEGGASATERVISGRNESCDTRVDCEPGYACLNGSCVVPDAPIEPTGKSCVEVECLTFADCCQPPEDVSCATFKTECEEGDQASCNQFAYYCDCTESSATAPGWSCTTDNRCEFKKTCDPAEAEASAGYSQDCGVVFGAGSGNTCRDDGVCVACISDENCGEGTCSASGQCVECESDDDCGFGACSPSGNCVFNRECWADTDCNANEACDEEGQCVERDCNEDRDCINRFRNFDATCKENKCHAPCRTDAECNPFGGYQGFICHEGGCVEAGCESNEECQALNGYPNGPAFLCSAD